mmetsp:Transcript_100113/g.269015  ORF Transcript_100113/g.269015 Transcript_100113/m.269015 type:complete len:232 (+) Transcript_100113:1675-2370(+)
MDITLGVQTRHGHDDGLRMHLDLVHRQRLLQLPPMREEVLEAELGDLCHHVQHAVAGIGPRLALGVLGEVNQLHEYVSRLDLLQVLVPQLRLGRLRERLHQILQHRDLALELLHSDVLELRAFGLLFVDLDSYFFLAIFGHAFSADARCALAHDVISAHQHVVLTQHQHLLDVGRQGLRLNLGARGVRLGRLLRRGPRAPHREPGPAGPRPAGLACCGDGELRGYRLGLEP